MEKQNIVRNVEEKNENLVNVYVRINPETVAETRGLNPEIRIRYHRFGGRAYPCAVYAVPRAFAEEFERMQQTESKAEQRKDRCWLVNGKGNYVHCLEKNRKCRDCEFASAFCREALSPACFEALLWVRAKGGVGFDGEGLAAPHEGELAAARLDEESVARMVDIMIRRLAKIRPKYGLIFRELFSGNTCPSQIAKALGLKKSQIYADVEKVRKLSAKIYFDLLEE